MSLLIGLASVVCAGLILYRYFQIRRFAAGIGWTMLILAIGGSGSGLAASIQWGGFVFIFLGACGILIIFQDVWFRRRLRQSQQRSG
jgi:hypothetical protein